MRTLPLKARAEGWAWSSVRAHPAGADDSLVTARPVLDRAPDFDSLIRETPDDGPARFEALRRAEMTGRPAGDAGFVATVERTLGRIGTPGPRGRPAKRGGGGIVGLIRVNYIMSRFS